MSTHKYFDRICYVVIAVVILITVGCYVAFNQGWISSNRDVVSSEMFSSKDLSGDWDSSGAKQIILSGDSATIEGSTAYMQGGDLYIIDEGSYVISGELTNGSIIVNAEKTDDIFIKLDSVSVNCDDSAAISVSQANKVYLTLADGTENTLTSGDSFSSDATSAGIDGTIYSKDDLTINGTGSLNVTAGYKHGIVCNDNLIITGGEITVNAPQDTIHANDSVRIREATLDLTAGDDGITVSNDDNTAYFYIESGNITINQCYEGIEAIDITIAGGNIEIYPTDDGINANGAGESKITIEGGDIKIVNESGRDADGLDSNGSIYITGGNTFISLVNDGSNSALDYGTENGGVCEISGGTIIACGSSGMAEGFDSSSSQGFIMYSTSAQAGTTVTLKDSSGKQLISEEIPCSFSSIVVSTDGMKVGDTYTLDIGSTSTDITVDNQSSSNGMGGQQGGQGDMQQGGMGGQQGNQNSMTMPDNQGTVPDKPTGEMGGQQGAQQDGQTNTSATTTTATTTEAYVVQTANNNSSTQPQMPSGDMQQGGMQQGDMGGQQGDQNSMTMPDNQGTVPDKPTGDMSGGDMNNQNGQPSDEKGDTTSEDTTQTVEITIDTIIYFVASIVILVLGIVFAIFFKRRRY